jgi:hypothetical protein
MYFGSVDDPIARCVKISGYCIVDEREGRDSGYVAHRQGTFAL